MGWDTNIHILYRRLKVTLTLYMDRDSWCGRHPKDQGAVEDHENKGNIVSNTIEQDQTSALQTLKTR